MFERASWFASIIAAFVILPAIPKDLIKKDNNNEATTATKEHSRSTRWLQGNHPTEAPSPSPPPSLVPVVCTLSTMPGRVHHLKPMLDSTRAQTPRRPDRVYVCIPRRSVRTESAARAFYDVPAWLLAEDNPWRARVVRTERDWGPATKLLGVLTGAAAGDEFMRNPLTRIVVLDDDWVYPSNAIAALLHAARCRDDDIDGHDCERAAGTSGANLTDPHWAKIVVDAGDRFHGAPQSGALVVSHGFEAPREMSADILQGAFGVLVQRKWFLDGGDDDGHEQPLGGATSIAALRRIHIIVA